MGGCQEAEGEERRGTDAVSFFGTNEDVMDLDREREGIENAWVYQMPLHCLWLLCKFHLVLRAFL